MSQQIDSQSIERTIFNSIFIEEYPPISGDYGGNFINEEFINRLIIELFGEEKVKQFQNDPKNKDWDIFMKEIEDLKRKFSYFEPIDFRLDCRLFEDNLIDKNLDDYISEYIK